jgi:hypothetical protein
VAQDQLVTVLYSLQLLEKAHAKQDLGSSIIRVDAGLHIYG